MAGVFHLSDGRALGYSEWGDPEGAPVFGFHGTSLSRLAHVGDDAPRVARVRLVLVDRPGYGLMEAAKLETVARGPDGYARDLFLLYVAPWGFKPEEIRVPTEIWQGDADEAVSPKVAEFFAVAIPDSRLNMVPGAGHLLLWSHTEEILRSLAS